MTRFVKLISIAISCVLAFVGHSQDLTEQFFFTTVKIDAYKDTVINNKKVKRPSIGTGFFYSMAIGKDTFLTIISNDHVISNCNTATIRFNLYDGKTYGETETIYFTNFHKLWIHHPSEDLAMMPILPTLQKVYSKTGKAARYKTFSDSLILTNHKDTTLNALVDVLMIGYPKGFHDKLNNLPIIRRGMTATPVYLDYNKEQKFLIDIPIFEGCSGSPVVQYEPLGYTDNKGNTILSKRLILLGVVSQQREYLSKSTIVDEKNKTATEIQTWSPFNIGVVIKAEKILDFKTLLLSKISQADYTDLYLGSIK